MAESHIESVVVRGQGITVPLLVWRRFKRKMPGLVEQIFKASPWLANHGPILPIGTVVDIPIPPERAESETKPRVKLW